MTEITMPRDRKRGFRPMTVNDENYLWRVTWMDEHTCLELQYAGVRNGQILLVDLRAKPEMGILGGVFNLDKQRQHIVVRPKFVREAVIYGLEHGWTPHISAPILKIDAHEANLPFVELVKTEFDLVLDDILTRTPLIDDINLQGFDIDLMQALVNDQYLINIKTQKTDDPCCLILTVGELSPNCSDHLQAGEFMKKQWLNNICYKGFEAHQIIYKPQTIDFRFVTINKTAAYCVTGKVVINRY
jgi:hypothetical protein